MTDEHDEHDRTVIQLGNIRPVLKSGVSSRAFTALSLTEKPYMTIQEVADVCGFSPTSLRYNDCLTNLFNAQLVESVKDENDKYKTKVKGYRLTERARRSMDNSAEAQIERNRERARKQTRTKKRPIHYGLSVVDGGTVGEATTDE
jgi:hypothetical protein